MPDKELVEGRYVCPLWLMVWGNTVYHCGEGVVLGAPVAMGTDSSCLFISVDQNTGMGEKGKPDVNLKFFPPHPMDSVSPARPTPKSYTTHQHYSTRLSVRTHKPLRELYI